MTTATAAKKKAFPVTVPPLEGRYADLKGVPLRDVSVPKELLHNMLKWRNPLYVTEAAIVLREREEAEAEETDYTSVPTDLWEQVLAYAKTQVAPF